MTVDGSTKRRARLARVVVAALTALALVSVWHSARPTWDRLRAEERAYADYSDEDRTGLASNSAGFSADLFGFLQSYFRDGDRFYVQAPRRPYGTLDLHDTFAALARFYLVPAVEVADLEDATVVISYESDPSVLEREFIQQQWFGEAVAVSRLSVP